jgi:hypothetical protein
MPVKFSVAAIETAKHNLDALPSAAKETRQVTLREAIRTLSPTIRRLMKKGYSRSAIVDLLKEQGMTVSMSTLKQYFREKASADDDADVQPPVSTKVTASAAPQSRPGTGRGLERASPPAASVAGTPRVDDASI